jgi:hypothetical protein
LEALFELLFKYRPVVFERGSLGFDWPVPWMALIPLALVAAVAGAWFYGRPQAGLSQRDRWVLGGLRVAVIAMVAACLARPVLAVSRAIEQRNVVGIVVDDSRSMRIADHGTAARGDYAHEVFGGADSALFKALAEKFQLRFFRASGAGGRSEVLGDTPLNGSRTHLATSLLRAEEELAGAPVAGMVLISDGADNTSSMPGATPMLEQLLALRARQIPVYAIGVGSERFARDIELSRVEVPGTVLREASILVEVVLSQRGYSGTKVPVVVEDSGRIIGSRDVALPKDGEATVVRIRVPASEKGARLLKVRVPVQNGEMVKENNERDAVVVVSDRREKILYLEGEPRYELKFIRMAVEDDKNLQVVTLLRSAKDKFLRLSVDDSVELSTGFPKNSSPTAASSSAASKRASSRWTSSACCPTSSGSEVADCSPLAAVARWRRVAMQAHRSLTLFRSSSGHRRRDPIPVRPKLPCRRPQPAFCIRLPCSHLTTHRRRRCGGRCRR